MNIFKKLLKKVKTFLGGSTPAKAPETSEKPARNYITLHFGDDGKVDGAEEGLPDEFFEDESPKRDLRDLDILDLEDEFEDESEIVFIASCVAAGIAVAGIITVIGRVLIYPFIKKLTDDDFMG